jgi:hypothetical protein
MPTQVGAVGSLVRGSPGGGTGTVHATGVPKQRPAAVASQRTRDALPRLRPGRSVTGSPPAGGFARRSAADLVGRCGSHADTHPLC